MGNRQRNKSVTSTIHAYFLIMKLKILKKHFIYLISQIYNTNESFIPITVGYRTIVITAH